MHSLENMRLQFREAYNETKKQARVIVGLGTCGIAAGGNKRWDQVGR